MNLSEIFSATVNKDFLALNSIYIVAVVAVSEAVKAAKIFNKKYIPLTAICLGGLLGFGSAITNNVNAFSGIINGVISGAIATGLYSAIKSPIVKK